MLSFKHENIELSVLTISYETAINIQLFNSKTETMLFNKPLNRRKLLRSIKACKEIVFRRGAMKYIVSISGGIGSFAAAKRVIDKYGKENVDLVFCDTKTEDEDLYRFLDDIEKHFDMKIIKLIDGRDIWKCAEQDEFLYNSRVANCTIYLKGRLFRKWLKKTYKPDECIICLGFDWNEPHRQKNRREAI